MEEPGRGERAARSHTASLSVSMEIFKSVAKQTGITLASDTEELVDLALAFSLTSLPEGRRVGVVTGGGCWGFSQLTRARSMAYRSLAFHRR